MSSALSWRTEEFPAGVNHSTLLREATLDNRLNALRDIALTILSEVESLRSTPSVQGSANLKLHDEVARFETDLILSALQKTDGSQVRAARLLGVKQSTLNAKIQRYKISPRGGRGADERVQSQEIAA
jgi:DNA-binding NtrC family response regulator